MQPRGPGTIPQDFDNPFGLPQFDVPDFGGPTSITTASPKKGGMFGSGMGAKEVLGRLISGYLAGRGNPVGSIGLHMINQRRQQALDEAQYQRRRKDAIEDYGARQQIEAQYAKPAQPHYFEDNMGNQWAIGADGKPQMVHKDDFPFKLVPNGLGGVVPVDLRTLMAGQGAPQGIPQTLSDKDWPTEGGPTPQASGGFRSPY